MKQLKIMIGIAAVALALAACSKEDNPVSPSEINIDDPQEVVTDQPAYAPGGPQAAE